ncbi:DUF4407 domain-containing protein [Microbacterium sp. PAMC22086]|uniref:DUF4407 domain-containing protein n=1 Tax=Microbacterium sp. PAMC22086 TaxID=2861281 RepID=UPI001C626526|nr:DUF4407 domain-containing protein [Microbacterium sp. PAMC22086]QYG12662.1 DUF4407 domain-containing protein [Microbacterium sp. PAMC22086]
MPYSAHRPGRYDSQGRIILDSEPDAVTDDLDFLREFEPTGTDNATREASASATSEATPIADALVSEEPAPVKPPRARRPRKTRPPRTPGSRARTLAILGGAEGEILDRVPGETPRFVQMFFVLAGTALVSAISMLFALTTGVQAAIWLAVPLALVWALIIFNLDRFLTSTMSSTRNVWRLIGLAIPRVIMAAIIGFVVAEPLVLQIFHNDIAREVASTNITQSQSDQEALESGPEKIALDAASAKVAELENQAATGIVAGTDASSATESAAQATVDDVTAKMTAQQAVIDQARVLYQCELTGEGAGTVPGCTGVNGQGASSDAAKAQLAEAQQTYDALAAQLRTANEELAAAGAAAKENTSSSEAQNREQAKSQLPTARDSYDQALAAYNARADAVAQGNAGAVGLLSQISGLNRLSEKEPSILWAHILIAALFFMIELLPVLVKVLTSYGDPSLYEKAAAIRKQVALDRVTAEGFRDRAKIVTDQSQEVQAEAGSGEPQTRAERREAAEAQERERAEKRAQAQTLEEQEQLVRPTIG